MKKSIYVDINVLQTVPPSCVNRDDTGSPKTAVYGGVTRARVSSQSWKHAMRVNFKDFFEGDELGFRTKKVVDLLAAEISKKTGADATKKAVEALANAGLKIKDAEKGADALFFISVAQIRALAALVVADDKDKKKYKEALTETPSIDMALFGRMVASDAGLNIDASAQVAHAISTHAVQNEYDYFTAVDDCSAEDEAGAGHLGTVEFNSSTLYRYATVNATDLYSKLGDDTSKVVKGFIKAFVESMPTGKQNTFANRNLPAVVYVTIREGQPINLSGAFEKPISKSNNGYVEKSEEALVKYVESIRDNYGINPEISVGFSLSGIINQIASKYSYQEILDLIEKEIIERLGEAI